MPLCEQVMAASNQAPAEGLAGDGGEEAEAADDTGVAASAPDQDRVAGLTDAQLMEVFKQTSIFNVRSALANNDALMSTNEAGENEERCVLHAKPMHETPMSSCKSAMPHQAAVSPNYALSRKCSSGCFPKTHPGLFYNERCVWTEGLHHHSTMACCGVLSCMPPFINNDKSQEGYVCTGSGMTWS